MFRDTHPPDNAAGTPHDWPNGLRFALFYSLQATARAPMQGLSYSVRSACMGSMEAARRAGIMAAIKPETASKAQTDRIVIGSCRPTPKRHDCMARVANQEATSPDMRPSASRIA